MTKDFGYFLLALTVTKEELFLFTFHYMKHRMHFHTNNKCKRQMLRHKIRYFLDYSFKIMWIRDSDLEVQCWNLCHVYYCLACLIVTKIFLFTYTEDIIPKEKMNCLTYLWQDSL